MNPDETLRLIRKSDRVRLVISPSYKRSRIAKMRGQWATVLNVVDNSMNEWLYPVAVITDSGHKIAVKLSECERDEVMDPNETLRRLRDLTSLRLPISEDMQQEAFDLVSALNEWLSKGLPISEDTQQEAFDLVSALDEWLSKGGFLPDA